MGATARYARRATLRVKHGGEWSAAPTGPRPALVRAMVERKRRQMPEVLGDPTRCGYAELVQAVELDGRISVLRLTALPFCLGSAIGFRAIATITIDDGIPSRAALFALAHEWGHVLLHVRDQALVRARAAEIAWRRARNLPVGDGPIYAAAEAEADLFAALLLGIDPIAYADEARAMIAHYCRRAWQPAYAAPTGAIQRAA